MSIYSKVHRIIIGFAGALAITALSFGGALAVDPSTSVTQVITGGTLTASIANASLNSLTYSNVLQPNTGTLTLSVNDATGLSKGWNVSVSSSSFVYAGTSSYTQQPIPATAFSITTAGTPTVDVAGQPVDLTYGPKAAGTGTLSGSGVQTISSAAGDGSGAYKQVLNVLLNVPALSQAGTYTAVLTVTVTNAP